MCFDPCLVSNRPIDPAADVVDRAAENARLPEQTRCDDRAKIALLQDEMLTIQARSGTDAANIIIEALDNGPGAASYKSRVAPAAHVREENLPFAGPNKARPAARGKRRGVLSCGGGK